MTVFIDHCTTGDCGEPATSWLASRVGEAFCPAHTPAPAAPADGWERCPRCAFTCRVSEWPRLVTHLDGHVRAARDELELVDRKHRAQACRMVELVDGLQAVVTQAREAVL